MRSTHILAAAISVAAFAAACGSSSGSSFSDEGKADAGTSGTSGNLTPIGSSGTAGIDGGGTSGADPNDHSLDIDQATLRIDPPNAVLTVQGGKQVTQPYKIYGHTQSDTTEQDLTSRFVFYVPDNFLVGGFPLAGGPLFTSRLPQTSSDPPQRAGTLTVQARANNSDGEVKITTGLTVNLTAEIESPNTFPSLPPDPGSIFKGTTPDPTRAPTLVYPNDGTMLPPNLHRLEVHWWPGSTDNTLYEIRFTGATADIVYYSRCSAEDLLPESQHQYVDGACAFELDSTGYGYLAESNRGTGPVTLKIRGTDEDGNAWGESAEFSIEFAENTVEGGLYYWRVHNLASDPPQGIMRFDFGAPSGNAEAYITQGMNAQIDTCPGCHSLSRDGTKLTASLGGQNDGREIFIQNIAVANTDPSWLTVAPNTSNGETNRIQFTSFSPDGSQFVAVYGDDATSPIATAPAPPYEKPADLDRTKLWFYDGNTGLRSSSRVMPYKPDHPDWSPDGNYIAVTHDGVPTTTTQRPMYSGIDVLQKSATDPSGFGDPINIVPLDATQRFNRFNPNFVPDSSFLYYTESDCTGPKASDSEPSPCDGDADVSATTWAVKPTGGAPIRLTNANTPGVADTGTVNYPYLGNTFPRSAPFETVHRGGKLYWFTSASRRKFGLRILGNAQHLWMFAVDPAKIMNGDDGSYTGFYLPFQDPTTSNHIGQWTQKVVGSTQPPPEPPPAAPPAPPAPPISIK